MYYKGLHTIAGTKEKTFGDQDESDTVLQDLEVLLCLARRVACLRQKAWHHGGQHYCS